MPIEGTEPVDYAEISDALRRAYDTNVSTRARAQQEDWKLAARERFLDRLRAEDRRTLLELGPGPGMYARFFADAGLDVTCVDLSPAMVDACRARGLTAVVGDCTDLPGLLRRSFDAVFALNCLLHVPPTELPRALTAVHDVLLPDGLFFLGQYGGIDFRGYYADDTYAPKRYFSFLPDAGLRRAVDGEFHVIEFTTVELERHAAEFHFQALTLRRR